LESFVERSKGFICSFSAADLENHHHRAGADAFILKQQQQQKPSGVQQQ
jgi:hypothetical protein